MRIASTAIALSLCSAALLGACRSTPEPDPEPRSVQALPVGPSWLDGQARFHRSFESPTFGVALRLRGADFSSLENALGINNPCFSVAFVERCENGVNGPVRPNFSLDLRGRATTLDVPIWCPSVGTSFGWQAEFTDYRRVLGNPGTRFQPLMRCGGAAVGAVFLFPSPLHIEPGVLPRPGIPLNGIQVTDWVRL